MNIQGIDHVAVNVRDLDKAMAFYTQVLGLKVTEREPSKPGIEYFLDCGPSLLGLIQAGENTNDHRFCHEGLGANHFAFRVTAADFEAAIGRLQAAGVKIEYAKKRPNSWSLYFYDPDGNKVEMTAWPREEGLPEERLVKQVFRPETGEWKSY